MGHERFDAGPIHHESCAVSFRNRLGMRRRRTVGSRDRPHHLPGAVDLGQLDLIGPYQPAPTKLMRWWANRSRPGAVHPHGAKRRRSTRCPRNGPDRARRPPPSGWERRGRAADGDTSPTTGGWVTHESDDEVCPGHRSPVASTSGLLTTLERCRISRSEPVASAACS